MDADDAVVLEPRGGRGLAQEALAPEAAVGAAGEPMRTVLSATSRPPARSVAW